VRDERTIQIDMTFLIDTDEYDNLLTATGLTQAACRNKFKTHNTTTIIHTKNKIETIESPAINPSLNAVAITYKFATYKPIPTGPKKLSLNF